MTALRLAFTATAAVLLPSLAAAQDGILHGWDHGQVSIYGWLPGITGEEEAPDGEPFVQLDGIDVLAALEMAFFGAAEIRRGRVGLVFDFEYADLEQDGKADRALVPGADPIEGSVGTTLTMASGFVAYRVLEDDRRFADVFAGVRAFDIEADFDFSVDAIGFDFARRGQVNWVDPVVGVRARTDLGRGFGVTGLADVGGFGIGESSDLTWQVTGTLDYAVTESVDARIGYRYMSIDYDAPGLGLDLDLHGPLIGVTWTF
jgi:opacity protein-like surface antigen